MNKNQTIVSTEFLLAAFRALTPENQKYLIESLKALESSAKQKIDADDLAQKTIG